MGGEFLPILPIFCFDGNGPFFFDFDENSCIIFVGVICRYGADGVNNLQVGKRRLCWKSETKDIDRQVERPRCDAANKIASRWLY